MPSNPPAFGAPTRFTIRPDDYHVPYAGTAQDGRKFFLSNELFDPDGRAWAGLFLWKPDGTFDEVQVKPWPGSEGWEAAPGDGRTASWYSARSAWAGPF
ncbi:MAG: hypothetical protein IPN45_02200 [Actinomycetales bacterium]|nr:hypothetical protein [Actinomycetales bacterium]